MNMTPAIETSLEGENNNSPPGLIDQLINFLPRVIVPMFSLFFLGFAVAYAVYAVVEALRPLFEADKSMLDGLVRGLHTGVVALAVYELAQIVHQEHDHAARPEDIIMRIRRGVARFGSVVFVALVLESLILVIKYAQQDLAGYLYYPAALIASAAACWSAWGCSRA